jgi:hypothetical protein
MRQALSDKWIISIFVSGRYSKFQLELIAETLSRFKPKKQKQFLEYIYQKPLKGTHKYWGCDISEDLTPYLIEKNIITTQ